MNNKISFWGFLTQHKVVIPTIQRDYAQGRKEKVALRQNFLDSIQNSLSKNQALSLDFVYGVQSSESICPIDGQQRLTTLWLLHWYATFLSSQKIRDTRAKTLVNFSYQTRSSSADFIRAMCDALMNEQFQLFSQKVGDLIQNQSWFHAGWRQDPTIRAMLRMLSGSGKKDGIQEVFTATEYLTKLFGDDCPITFYYLDLVGIQQSDRLYVKMNARGEQLTDLENFKADLMSFFEQQGENLKTVISGQGIYQKWDGDWTDLFWEKCCKGQQEQETKVSHDRIDDFFFTWIKRFLLTQYICQSEQKKDANDKCIHFLYDDELNKYDSFVKYKEILLSFGDKLDTVLNSMAGALDKVKNKYDDINKAIDSIPLLKTRGYEINGDLLPCMGEDNHISKTSFQHRIVTYGILSFFNNWNGQEGCFSSAFQQWLRLIANITYGDEVENKETFIDRLTLIYNICNQMNWSKTDIYEAFAAVFNNSSCTISKTNQIEEELQKIQIIASCATQEKDIRTIESIQLFSGNVGAVIDNNCIIDIDKILQSSSDNNPHSNIDLRTLLRAILTNYDASSAPECIDLNNDHEHLRKLLNKELKKALQITLKTTKTMQDIINDFLYNQGLTPDWLYLMVKNENLWEYSEKCRIRRRNNDVYLYKKTYRDNERDILLKCESDGTLTKCERDKMN